MAAATQSAATPPPPPEPPAAGSAPGWVNFLAKNKTLAVIGIGTVLVMYSTKGTNSAAKQVQDHFNSTATATSGPKLANRESAQSDGQLQAAMARLDASQKALDEKLKNAGLGNNGAGGQQQSSSPTAPQISPEQQIEQQIRADRAKAGYESLWSSPIIAAPHVEMARNAASIPGAAALPQPIGTMPVPVAPQPAAAASSVASPAAAPAIAPVPSEEDPNKGHFAYDASVGPYHIIPRYTLIGGTMLNQVNTQTGGIVIVQLDPMDKVYIPGTKTLLLPEGTQLLGNATTISSGGGDEHLMGISFDAIRTPDQYTIPIPKMAALSENGQTGVPGHVNAHTASTIGWTVLLGGIAGMSEIGNSTSSLTYSPASTFRQQFSDNVGQQTIQNLSQHVMNRARIITVPAGTRLKAVLAEDLPGIPEWENHRMKPL